MVLNVKIQKIINQEAEKLGIPRIVATAAYRSLWLFIKEKIGELPELYKISREDFDKLRVSFHIREFGKITTNYKKVKKTNQAKWIINERYKNKRGEANA